MCDDHRTGLSRRQFLGGTVASLAAPALLRPSARAPVPRRLPLRSPQRPQDGTGNSAYSMAMHIHGSCSEFGGSWGAHAYQATVNAVDTVFYTDHDERMNSEPYRDVVHFTSLTKEEGGPGQGGTWDWQKQFAGTAGGGIVTNPSSPNDTVSGGALHARAGGGGTAGFYANAKPSAQNYHCTLAGQTISIDVLTEAAAAAGYLEVAVESSMHEPSGGRPAGRYSLSYRLVRGSGAASMAPQGTLGVITVPVTAGSWQTVSITPENDIAQLWPEMNSQDFAIAGLTLRAVSTGGTVNGYFDYLRFNRTTSGSAQFQMQADVLAWLQAKYPDPSLQQGIEWSGVNMTPHVNGFGPGAGILDYPAMTLSEWEDYLAQTAIPGLHQAGGLASYNHPFGTSQHGGALPPAEQDAGLQAAATALLGNSALGADLIEAGYPLRAGYDLAHHAGLWDVMSRNAVFLTGIGVSDDHVGGNWRGMTNNWVTSAWATGNAPADLLAALAAGQAWCGSLSGFALPSGAVLDLLADGTCPMGSASVSSVTSRQVTVIAAGLPTGGSVQLLQGAVDYAGTADPAPGTSVITSITAADFDGNNQATQAVDTTADSFVRSQVLDGTGNVVALSNPIWLLQNEPPNGIPAPRQT